MRTTPITVGELIEQLQKYDKTLPVHTEGCDCIGPSDGVNQTYTDAESVVIGRDDSLRTPPTAGAQHE